MSYNVRLPNGVIVQNIPDDMPQEEVRARILKNFPDVAAEQERGIGEIATDLGASLGVGTGRLLQVPGQLGQLAGLYDADEADTGLQGLGQSLEEASTELKSPTLIGKEALRAQEVDKAEGFFPEFGTAFKETLTDPTLLSSFLLEQVPNLFGSMGGGLLARGGVNLLLRNSAKEAIDKTVGRAGISGAVGTGAAMQGADVGTDTYERIYSELQAQGVPVEQANERALTQARQAAIQAAALTVGTSLLPGGRSIERVLAGKGAPGVGGALRAGVGEFVSEGIEEGGGQLVSNIGVAQEIPGTSLTEGVGEATAMGSLAGGLFGAPAGGISGRRNARAQAELDKVRAASEQGKKIVEDLETAEQDARRAAFEAEQAETQRRIFAERYRNSPAYAELETKVSKIKERADNARKKLDNEYTKISAFTGAEPDLFGQIFTAPPETSGIGEIQSVDPRTPQGAPIPVQEGQLELDLPSVDGQAGLPGIGIAQPRAPQAAPQPAATVSETGQLGLPGVDVGRTSTLVTEADLSTMGVGPTNKKLRKAIIGKDLGVPSQAAEVKRALENYASSPDRSGRIATNVENFLQRPEFAVQLPLGIRTTSTTPVETAPVDPAPIVTETSLDGLALPKRSAARKRLLGKNLDKPADRKKVVTELQRLAANPNLNPDTRQRVRDVLAGSPFIRTQGELFGPKGGVTQAARQPTPDTAPTDTAPAAAPTDTAPTDTAPTDTAPTDTAPTDTAPTDTAPAAAPTDTAPTDTAPTDTAPTDTAPTDTSPTTTSPTTEAPTTSTVPTTDAPTTDAPTTTVPKKTKKTLDKVVNPPPENTPASETTTPDVEPAVAAPVEPTAEQKQSNQTIANGVNGFVLYEDGDTALVRGYDRRSGKPLYIAVKGDNYTRVDVDSYTGDIFTPEEKAKLSDAKQRLEEADREKHKTNPFIKFTDGVAVSSDIDVRLEGVIRGLKNLLGLDADIYVTTRKDGIANQANFTGPHRAIAFDVATQSPKGSTRRMGDGAYYITFTQSSSLSLMIETIAHEMGHIHETLVFKNADAATKEALRDAHKKWVMSQKGKTAGELVNSLRARQGARTIKGNRSQPASNLSPYWTSFSEWYADQVSRWSVSSEKPLSVVDKFFAKLANALRRFYNSIRAQGFLPNETFKQYLDSLTPNIQPTDSLDPVFVAWEDMKPDGAPPFGALLPVYRNQWRRLVQRNRATMSEADLIVEAQNQATKEMSQKDLSVKYSLNEISPRMTNPLLEDISNRAGGVPETPPKKTAFQTAKEAVKPKNIRDRVNKFETRWFSFDAGFSNRIWEELSKSPDGRAAIEAMQSISTSQALHADGMAAKFLEKGNIKYNPSIHMYEAVNDENNYINLVGVLDSIAKEEGISFDVLKQYANQAFIAERINGMSKTDKDFYSNMTPEQVKAGLEFFDALPRLREVQAIWNGMRGNAMNVAVESGLYTKKEAEDLLNVMDYVPFFREDQIAAGAGPREYGRGLLDFTKGRKIKGSDQKVNDIFDNMERWTSYTVSRSVKNRTANNMLDLVKKTFPEEVTELRQDETVRNEERQNVIDIYVSGQKKRVKFADPLFVDAFGSMANITMPLVGGLGETATKAADVLRKTVVLMPLFSISQLSQDGFSAMFTSGLRSPLRVPFEVFKEFTATLMGRSAAHDRLGDVAAAGIRDYSSTVARSDVEIQAGLRKPGAGKRAFNALEKFAMASDNAVRQAIYNRTLLETGGVRTADGGIRGGDEATAIRRAFEIINFKRSGNSRVVQVGKQVVPFFGAYLQAMNVMYKVTMGRGLSPQERGQAWATLATTTAKVMALSFLYTALVADDDEYKEMDPSLRDRTLMIPGTSFKMPMRPDIFLLPKMIGEYTYLGITEDGFTDSTKVKRAFRDAIANSVLSPTAVPQFIKPAVEVGMNYSFFTGRPIIGRGLETKKTALQYSNYSSELAKILGNTGLIAPVNADHLMRGYLGTVGGAANFIISAAVRASDGRSLPEVPLPDDIASFPGMSPFVTRTYGTGIKNDFYELRTEVDKAVSSINWLKKYRPRDEVVRYMDENRDLIGLRTPINRITKQLSTVREQERKTREAPDSRISAKEKGEIIERLRLYERRLLQQVPILRQRAGM